MPRFLVHTVRSAVGATNRSRSHSFATTTLRPLSFSSQFQAEKSGTSKNDSTPGWSGRHIDDHAVKRDGHDVQSESAQQAMKDHESLKKGSQAISRQDEGNSNERAKKDRPAAPEPVIGMNDERGAVSPEVSQRSSLGAATLTILKEGTLTVSLGGVLEICEGVLEVCVPAYCLLSSSNMERKNVILAHAHTLIFSHSSASVTFDKGYRRIAHDFSCHVANGTVLLDQDTVAENSSVATAT